MKRFLFCLSIFSAEFIFSSNSLAARVSVFTEAGLPSAFFYSSLAPHGEWIELESGTQIWRPFHISHQWRPYLLGRWVWTEYGWYWMSEEPFGWITYHYGRWYNDEYYGWVWIPDDVWAPAWVEWRYDDHFIGWAPLPPFAAFNLSVGIRFTTRWAAPVHYWNFVRYRRFGTVIHYRDTAPEAFAGRIVRASRPGLSLGIDHERIINRGIDRSMIERRGNIRFTRTEVVETHEQTGERLARLDNHQRIEIYRPAGDELQRSTGHVEARRGERNLSFDPKRLDRPRSTRRPPQGVEPPSRIDHQQMRRDLIQRHERHLRPSPPAVREDRQQRIERGRQNHPLPPPDRSSLERRPGERRER